MASLHCHRSQIEVSLENYYFMLSVDVRMLGCTECCKSVFGQVTSRQSESLQTWASSGLPTLKLYYFGASMV
jgi:hypothetical protein